LTTTSATYVVIMAIGAWAKFTIRVERQMSTSANAKAA